MNAKEPEYTVYTMKPLKTKLKNELVLLYFKN